MNPKHLLSGVRKRLLVSFSLLISSIAVFVFIFFPAHLERQAMRAETGKANAVAEVTAYRLGPAVLLVDTAAIRDALSGVARLTGVTALTVRDSLGKVLVAAHLSDHRDPTVPRASPAAPSVDGPVFTTTTAIAIKHHRVGSLTLAVSLTELHDEVVNARRVAALVGLLIIAAGYFIVYAISTRITRPLHAVSRTVERIAAGDLHLRVEETAGAEVSQLVTAFNKMVNNLALAQAELSANNLQLEARVESRTVELQQAMADQRHAQSALVESEKLARATADTLQSLIDVAPQAIISVDLNWRITRWNAAAERLFGWSESEVFGNEIPIIPGESTLQFQERRESVQARREMPASEQIRMRKDGTLITVLVAVSELRNAAGIALGFIAVITDLTERKSLEEQLRQSQKMEAIGRLAGGVAHDFNNMLTVITSSAALVREHTVNADDLENVDAIATAAARASGLTRQLLLFSRKQVVNLVPLNVNDVVTDMSPMLRRLVRENIQFRTALDDGLGDVNADPTQVQQAIMNLVVNASDAMPDGGIVTIETRNVRLDADYVDRHTAVSPGKYVRLTVSDTGIGMDHDTRTKIFEPFFTTKEAGVGTGLGLATTYAVVSQLGGHMRVYTELGHGTALKIFLPRLATARSGVRPTPLSSIAVPYQTTLVTILLVEDEASVRKAIRRTLERFGFAILEATDGESALAVAAQHIDDIDIVLTDLMMPGMNGRAFADQLAHVRRDLPVVFMSGYTDDTVNQRGLVDDTHAFLQKPFSGEQLVRTIRELIYDGEEGRAFGSGTANSSAGGLP